MSLRALIRRQQIHLGVGDDQAVGEQLREIAHDPFPGSRMRLAKTLEIGQRHFETNHGLARHPCGQRPNGSSGLKNLHKATAL